MLPPVVNKMFMGQFAINAANEVYGPASYMSVRGNALLDLADSEDPDTIELIRRHMLDGFNVQAAVLAMLNEDFDSWIASMN